MYMNKIIERLICIFGIHTMSEQITLCINFLNTIKKILLEEGIKKGKHDKKVFYFDNNKMYIL